MSVTGIRLWHRYVEYLYLFTPVNAEQIQGIFCSGISHLLKFHTLYPGYPVNNQLYIARVVPLASMGLGRQVRAVGFHQYFVEGNAVGRVHQLPGIGEGDRPCKGNIKTQLYTFLSHFKAAGETMHDTGLFIVPMGF